MLKNRVKEMIEELFAENPTVKGVRVTALADLFTKKLDGPVSAKFISELAREAGYEVERQSDGFMVMRKSQEGITPIDEIMNRIRENLEEKQRQDKEHQEANEEHKREIEAAVLALALDYVPGFMRSYASVDPIGQEWRVIFSLPKCAPITRTFKISELDGDGLPCKLYPVAVNGQEYYSVSLWYVFDDSICVDWQYAQTFADLNEALVSAMERGDNRAKCEQSIRESQKRWQERQAEAEARKKLPYCPLKLTCDDPYCDTVKCAWFITNVAITDCCAVKIIAHAEMAKVVEYSDGRA